MHRFQAILDAPRSGVEPWNRALAESKSFIAFPSLGSMVAGWLLIVPRRPMLNMRELNTDERSEFHEFATMLISKLSSFSGEVYAFEHGNTTLGGPVGCGVDQAHTHLVPLDFDLIDAAVATLDENIRWTDVGNVATFADAIPSSGEYVSIWRPSDGRGLSGALLEPRSQWVRRVIANRLGREGTWDYKTNPETHNLMQTLKVLERA